MFCYVAVFVKRSAFSVTVLDKRIVVDEDDTAETKTKNNKHYK